MFGRRPPKTGYGMSLADQEDRWERFWGSCELEHEGLAPLDAVLRRMAFEDGPTNEHVRFTTERLPRYMRRWVHQRCGQLDFQSRTKGRDHSDDTGIVIIVRPAHWSFPERSLSPKKIRFGRPKKNRSNEYQLDNSDRRPSCLRCETPSLGVGEAFYRDAGQGFFCKHCIVSDESLLCLKWFPLDKQYSD